MNKLLNYKNAPFYAVRGKGLRYAQAICTPPPMRNWYKVDKVIHFWNTENERFSTCSCTEPLKGHVGN